MMRDLALRWQILFCILYAVVVINSIDKTSMTIRLTANHQTTQPGDSYNYSKEQSRIHSFGFTKILFPESAEHGLEQDITVERCALVELTVCFLEMGINSKLSVLLRG